jgi:hypothetical protein
MRASVDRPTRLNPDLIQHLEGIDEVEASAKSRASVDRPTRLNPELFKHLEGIDEVEASWESPSLIERLLVSLERLLVSPEISISLMPPKASAKGALGIAALVTLAMWLGTEVAPKIPARVDWQCVTEAKSVRALQRCSWFASEATASTAPTTPAAPNTSKTFGLDSFTPAALNTSRTFGLDSFEWSITLATCALLAFAARWAWMATRCQESSRNAARDEEAPADLRLVLD